jgi:signal transduction histidine kinase
LNPDLLLAWLSSNSAIKRVRAARGLKKIPNKTFLEEIRKHYHKEDVPWVKEALLSLIQKYEKTTVSKKKQKAKKQINDNLRADEIEAIISDAVSDSIGQILHEIEPVIGALKVVAIDEIDNYTDSELKKEFGRLDELLQTFENWRRVEQSPRYSKSNLYELVKKQVTHENTEGVEVEINIPKDLVFSADQILLKIIFSNALRNAVDASLNIAEEARQPVVISAGESEIGLWASVVDRGLGLPDSKKLILSGSYSTKPGHRGMGLAVIHKAINALEGEWDLKDGKIGGAVFFFEIPRKSE